MDKEQEKGVFGSAAWLKEGNKRIKSRKPTPAWTIFNLRRERKLDDIRMIRKSSSAKKVRKEDHGKGKKKLPRDASQKPMLTDGYLA